MPNASVHAFWLATTFACGLVAIDAAGIVVETCPIYRRRMLGKPFRAVLRRLRDEHRFVAYKLLRPQ